MRAPSHLGVRIRCGGVVARATAPEWVTRLQQMRHDFLGPQGPSVGERRAVGRESREKGHKALPPLHIFKALAGGGEDGGPAGLAHYHSGDHSTTSTPPDLLTRSQATTLTHPALNWSERRNVAHRRPMAIAM